MSTICTQAYTFAHEHAHVCRHVHNDPHTCYLLMCGMSIHTHAHAHARTRTHTQTHTNTHAHTHARTHTHTLTHTHTHTRYSLVRAPPLQHWTIYFMRNPKCPLVSTYAGICCACISSSRQVLQSV